MLSNRKSLLVILSVGVLVIGLAAWKFAASSKAEAPHLERYLPASTIGFVQVYNLRAQTLNIAESDAWKEYSKTNPTATSLLLMGANHAGLLDASYAVALTGVNIVNGKPEPGFALVGEATDGNSRDTFRRLLGMLSQGTKGSADATTEQYGTYTIKVFGGPNSETVAYAATGDLIVLSNSSSVVKSVLDARDGKVQTLADNPQLSQVRTQIGYNDGMFGFVDGVAISKLIDSLPIPNQKPVSMFREFFHDTGADSAQSVAMTSSFANGRVVERYTVFAKDGGHGAFHTVVTNPGTRQDLLNLVPDSATLVADASIANAAQTFDQLAAVASQLATENGQPSTQDFFQQVFSKTGIDVRNDFVQSLGSEACIAHLSLNGKEDGIAIVNLADQDKFSHVMDLLAQRENKTV